MHSLQRRQISVFVCGWVSYASTYLLRKPLGVIKTDLETSLSFSKVQLGWLDTSLLLPYAFAQIFFGSLGDKIGSRVTVAAGMVISGIALVSFHLWNNLASFILMFTISGAAQGMCWPNLCKILGSWYSDASRNSVFGIFGTSAFVGGIAGTLLAVFLQSTFGWRFVYLFPSLLVIVCGIFCYYCIYSPSEVNVNVPGRDIKSSVEKDSFHTVLDLCRLPMIIEISFAMFSLKLVRYCMYMWLPMFLVENLNYSKETAGWMSTFFEIGGVFGSAFSGFIIDRFFVGQDVLGTANAACLSTIALLAFFSTRNFGFFFNILFLSIAGAMNCGPDTILGGALPSEIGEKSELNAAAAVTGLVNGFGSFGACLEGPIIGFISQQYGWNGMIYFIVTLSALGTISCYRAHKIKNQNTRFTELNMLSEC